MEKLIELQPKTARVLRPGGLVIDSVIDVDGFDDLRRAEAAGDA